MDDSRWLRHETGTLISHSDFHPFEQVSLRRIRDEQGEPTHWYAIEGLRQGGERSCRVHCGELFDQADEHLPWHHWKSSETASTEEWRHAIVRATVTFLMD